LIQLVPVRESELEQMNAANRRRIFSSITADATASALGQQDKERAAAQLADAKKLLARFDKDANGKLDFDELAAASGQDKGTIKLLGGMFDKDADGALNPEELAAALSKLRP